MYENGSRVFSSWRELVGFNFLEEHSVLERARLLLDGLIRKSGIAKQSGVVPLNESLVTTIAAVSSGSCCLTHTQFPAFWSSAPLLFSSSVPYGKESYGLLSAQWPLVLPKVQPAGQLEPQSAKHVKFCWNVAGWRRKTQWLPTENVWLLVQCLLDVIKSTQMLTCKS